MEYVIVALVVGVFAYWRGLVAGVEQNVVDQLKELMEHIPINLQLELLHGIYYGRILNFGPFVGQSTEQQEIVDMAFEMFPDRTIIVSFKEEDEDEECV
jgi:hypothetical protein